MHGHKYGNQWVACSDYENCWVQVGDSRKRCQAYLEVHGKPPKWGQDNEAEKPWAKFTMCVTEEEEHGGDSTISKMLVHRDNNNKLIQMHESNELVGRAHLRVDEHLAGSHMVRKYEALYKTFNPP